MNTLYIIGNGFDLAHGLKTSYSDFLLWYLKDCAKKKTYATIFDDGLITLSGLRHNFNVDNLKGIPEILEYFAYNNITFNQPTSFIKQIFTHEKNYNWVDIESIYFSNLLEISKAPSTKKFEAIKTLNKQLDLLKQSLEEYLSSLDYIIEPLSSIESHFPQSEKDTVSKYLILNFNYTPTVENYTKKLKRCQIINIHGSLSELKSPIIFGYGDEMHQDYESIERLNYDEFLVNFKSFGYLKNSNYRQFEQFIDEEAFIVKILGHSCGLSDRLLLSTIFQHPKCERIEICYYKLSEVKNDHYEKTIKISRHFAPINKAKMRKLILPLDISKPLYWSD